MEQWKEAGFFFGEDDFEEKITTAAKEFRDTCCEEGYFAAADGTKIHYTMARQKEERAAIVISHGFCEFVRKYDECMYYFYRLGYSVYFIDHRGHGYSGRRIPEPDKVWVGSFNEYVGDLKQFMDEVVKANSPGAAYLLFAHSMGGAIGTLFLERYPDYFKAAVLSSPMMRMDCKNVPVRLVKLLAGAAVLIGRKYEYAPGQHGFDNRNVFETSSTLSRARYEYVFRARQEVVQYQTYGGTYGWTYAALKAGDKLMRQAKKVRIPVLLLQAGMDTMVSPKEQERFAKASKNTKLVCFPDSKHEIFNAGKDARESYFDLVFSFLQEQSR